MSYARFPISTTASGQRRTVLVHVYDTVDELRAAAASHSPATDWSESVGVCHGLPGIWPAPQHRRVLAIVRLCREHLTAKVTSHEIAHAAACIYGYDKIRPHSRAWNHMHAANEPLAYLVGDLYSELVGRLSALNYYNH